MKMSNLKITRRKWYFIQYTVASEPNDRNFYSTTHYIIITDVVCMHVTPNLVMGGRNSISSSEISILQISDPITWDWVIAVISLISGYTGNEH